MGLTDKKITPICLFLIAAGICQDIPSIEIYGTLRGIMQHQIEEKVNLSEFQSQPDIYAIGAVADLKGEILVIDSQPWVSHVEGKQVVTKQEWNSGAALLVKTEVKNWKGHQLPDSVNSLEKLEEYISRFYHDRPVPFMLTGKIREIKWHVIDWDAEDRVHTHKKHTEAGVNGTEHDTEVTILGFFSPEHQGVFTHHTRKMHLHVLLKNKKIAAHTDDLTPGADMILQLPE